MITVQNCVCFGRLRGVIHVYEIDILPLGLLTSGTKNISPFVHVDDGYIPYIPGRKKAGLESVSVLSLAHVLHC